MMTSAARPDEPHLLRVLGLVFGLAVVVGGVIGSGIMRAPGVVAKGITSEPLILFAWLLGGGAAMLAAMPLVEAGSSVPRAGGTYAIAERAFGPMTGFFTGWLSWLQYTASNAFIAVVFGEYVHRLGFAGSLSNGALACGLILAVALINWAGTRLSGASQSIASAAKGAAFLFLVVVLMVSRHAPVAAGPAMHPALLGVTSIGAVVMAIRVIYQTYAGWDAAIYFSEEVERPDRNVARATFWGIGLVTLLYIMVNFAVFHVLSPAAVAGSPLAVGDAAKISLGAAGDTVITAIGLLSLGAIVNLQIMAASRITWRMAHDGVLPPWLARVAKTGAPRRSVALVTIVSLMFAAIGGYETIVRVYAPWSVGAILMVCLSAIKLRISEPDLERPWKMPLFPWIAIGAALVQASLIAVMVWDDPKAGVWSLIAALAPLPVYAFFARTWKAQTGR